MNAKIVGSLLACLLLSTWPRRSDARDDVFVSSISSFQLRGGTIKANSLPEAVGQVLTCFKKEFPKLPDISLEFEPLQSEGVGTQQTIYLELAGLSVAEAMQFCAEIASSHECVITPSGFRFKGIASDPQGVDDVTKLYLSELMLERLNLKWTDPPEVFQAAIAKTFEIELHDLTIDKSLFCVSFARLPRTKHRRFELQVTALEMLLMEIKMKRTRQSK